MMHLQQQFKGGVRIVRANQFIRNYAKKSGVLLWQIADALGIDDSSFSRKLRHELDAEELDKVLLVINKIALERQEV